MTNVEQYFDFEYDSPTADTFDVVLKPRITESNQTHSIFTDEQSAELVEVAKNDSFFESVAAQWLLNNDNLSSLLMVHRKYSQLVTPAEAQILFENWREQILKVTQDKIDELFSWSVRDQFALESHNQRLLANHALRVTIKKLLNSLT